MESKKLIEFIDENELKSLQNKFARATGMGCGSKEADGSLIKYDFTSDYCIFTRLSEKGGKLCEECEKKDMEVAAKTGKVHLSRCHAGLINFTAPITVNGEVAGYLTGGQVFDKQPNMDEVKQLAEEMDIPVNRYAEAAHEAAVVPRRRIEGSAELLEELAKLLPERAAKKD